MLLLFIMMVGGLVTSVVASGKGRSGLTWFIIGALFPLPGVIIACTLKPELKGPDQL
jgi:hypothetical protein